MKSIFRNLQFLFCIMHVGVANAVRGLVIVATPILACCASTGQEIPVATAWKNVDLSETALRNATKRLQDSLITAANDMDINNCGDLGTNALRQSFLDALQATTFLKPSMASAALLARTRVLGSIQDLRRDAGLLKTGMMQLVDAFSRGEENPQDRGDMVNSLSRIKGEAESATDLIKYAEHISAQLQRLGG